MKKIKVKGILDKGREVIVRYETAAIRRWKGVESQMAMWAKRCTRS